ncbi:ricin-type beta-trefoil lectin domain protein [Streptomyces sp. NPDC127038]|uniref:ricin-type beta-trefoil lectin domain protein n=1 Tax=Streptomyces sp. NPDC127038 TaxID=3347114 RepID=UPI00364F64F9
MSDERLAAELKRQGGATANYPVGELLDRHWEAVFSYARLCTGGVRPAGMLTTASFTRIFGESLHQGGPSAAWRPQLLVTVRRIAAEWLRDTRRDLLRPELLAGAVLEDGRDLAPARLLPPEGRRLISRAFQRLPEPVRCLLWHTEVEAERPEVPAALLGIFPEDAVTELERARERLRQGCLEIHHELAPSQECRRYHRMLDVSFRRGGLGLDPDLRAHMDECGHCRYAADQLSAFNGELAVPLAEAVLGWGAHAYVASRRARAAAAEEPARQPEGDGAERGVAHADGRTDTGDGPAASAGRAMGAGGGQAFATGVRSAGGGPMFAGGVTGAGGGPAFAGGVLGAEGGPAFAGGATGAGGGWAFADGVAGAGGGPAFGGDVTGPGGDPAFDDGVTGAGPAEGTARIVEFLPGTDDVRPPGLSPRTAPDDPRYAGAPATDFDATVRRPVVPSEGEAGPAEEDAPARRRGAARPGAGTRASRRAAGRKASRRAPGRRNVAAAVLTLGALITVPLVLWTSDGGSHDPHGTTDGGHATAGPSRGTNPSWASAGEKKDGTVRGRLRNAATGLCVGFAGTAPASGAEARLVPCSSDSATQWSYAADGLLRAADHPSLCLDSHLGYSVQLAGCTGPSQPATRNVRYDFTLQGMLVPRWNQDLALSPASSTGESALVLKLRDDEPVQHWTLDTSSPSLQLEVVNWDSTTGDAKGRSTTAPSTAPPSPAAPRTPTASPGPATPSAQPSDGLCASAPSFCSGDGADSWTRDGRYGTGSASGGYGSFGGGGGQGGRR